MRAGGRKLRVGVLELLTLRARNLPDALYHLVLTKQFGSVMPQAVAAWSRRRGHRVHYALYYGLGDPARLLPDGLDVLFVCCHSQASPLAYALAKLQRRQGTLTVLGGPHARAFPSDALRFFDVVCGDTDEALVRDILDGHVDPGSEVSSHAPLADVPTVEERMPEIRASVFFQRRWPSPVGVVPMLASTGCPYACDFCVDWSTPYRQLPLDRLETDLRFLSERLPGLGMAIHDPNFAVRFDPVLDVMERIPEGRRPGYVMESSLSVLKGPRLVRLRHTNCAAAAPGIESWTSYSRKSGVGTLTGLEKVERVADHLAELHEHVPNLQVNLMFGLDEDRGNGPFELTRHFLDRTPFAWPALNVPVPFGGTPLHDTLRREDRVLKTLPFAFYYAPYLAFVPRHYDPLAFYDKLLGLFEHAVSPPMLKARLESSRPGGPRLIQRARTASSRRALASYREIRDRLRDDRQFRAFHEGRAHPLPTYYTERFDALLGRYAELLGPEERRPRFEAQPAAPALAS